MIDYEKAYKEALERAREFQKSKDGLCVLTAESIFPELKESEDERIRKELIQLISCMHDKDPRKKDWLAWLEKQGEMDEKQGWHNELEKAYEWLDNNFRVSSFDSTKIVTDFSNMYDLKDSFKKTIKNRL